MVPVPMMILSLARKAPGKLLQRLPIFLPSAKLWELSAQLLNPNHSDLTIIDYDRFINLSGYPESGHGFKKLEAR